MSWKRKLIKKEFSNIFDSVEFQLVLPRTYLKVIVLCKKHLDKIFNVRNKKLDWLKYL